MNDEEFLRQEERNYIAATIKEQKGRDDLEFYKWGVKRFFKMVLIPAGGMNLGFLLFAILFFRRVPEIALIAAVVWIFANVFTLPWVIGRWVGYLDFHEGQYRGLRGRYSLELAQQSRREPNTDFTVLEATRAERLKKLEHFNKLRSDPVYREEWEKLNDH